ncbi:MAG: hypothetical protein H6742_14440 [Alphaproteobacteria bacterium]|nr:hypothetical protein [Alphaproteobacteria bacterium]
MILLLSLLVACSDPPPPPKLEAPRDFDPTPPGGKLKAPDTGAPKSTNKPPRFKELYIEPDQITTTDTLLAVAKAVDPENERLDYDYVWIINEQNRPDLTAERLSPDDTAKGDIISVKVTLDDGTNQVEQISRPLRVGNTAPAFVGDPRLVGQIDGFTVKAEDADGDPLHFSMSGQPAGMTIHPTMGRIEYKGSEAEEGGEYDVKVTVDDGDQGTAEWSFHIAVSPGSEAARKKKEAEKAAEGAGG